MDDVAGPVLIGIGIVLLLHSRWRKRRLAAAHAALTVSAVGQVVTALPAPRAAPLANGDLLTPLGFERHCAAVLRANGWTATITAGSGDQGVDVLARRRDISVVIQCKLYSKPIGNRAVQEAIAGRFYMGATHAAVVSNQPYTSAARDLAQRTRVMLLAASDLPKLHTLLGPD